MNDATHSCVGVASPRVLSSPHASCIVDVRHVEKQCNFYSFNSVVYQKTFARVEIMRREIVTFAETDSIEKSRGLYEYWYFCVFLSFASFDLLFRYWIPFYTAHNRCSSNNLMLLLKYRYIYM